MSQPRMRSAPIAFADRPVFTVQETAELLHVSWRTVHRLLQKDELHGMRLGQQWRISRVEIDRFLRACEAAS